MKHLYLLYGREDLRPVVDVELLYLLGTIGRFFPFSGVANIVASRAPVLVPAIRSK